MTQEMIQKIKSHPDFKILIQQRSIFARRLTALMLSVYFGFILTIAFNPTFLATKIDPQGVTTYGIVIGILILLFSFVLTGFYTLVSNNLFDKEIEKVKKDLLK
jgi:uncharacterized membrane protein (DUF485 family)